MATSLREAVVTVRLRTDEALAEADRLERTLERREKEREKDERRERRGDEREGGGRGGGRGRRGVGVGSTVGTAAILRQAGFGAAAAKAIVRVLGASFIPAATAAFAEASEGTFAEDFAKKVDQQVKQALIDFIGRPINEIKSVFNAFQATVDVARAQELIGGGDPEFLVTFFKRSREFERLQGEVELGRRAVEAGALPRAVVQAFRTAILNNPDLIGPLVDDRVKGRLDQMKRTGELKELIGGTIQRGTHR